MVAALTTRWTPKTSLFAAPVQADLIRLSLSLGTMTFHPRKWNEARCLDLLRDCFGLVNSTFARRVSETRVYEAAAVAKSLAFSGKLQRLTLGRAQSILLDPDGAKEWKSVDGQRLMWGLTRSLAGRQWVPSFVARRPLGDIVAGLMMGDSLDALANHPTFLEPHARLPSDTVERMRETLSDWIRIHHWFQADLHRNARPLRRVGYPRVLLSVLPTDAGAFLDEAYSTLLGAGGSVPAVWSPQSTMAQRVLVHAAVSARIEELSRVIDSVGQR